MATRSEEKARFKKGMAAGVFGLCTNAVLFALKTAAGVLSGSITVVADAVNNLSDAGGSAVTFTGFKLASRPADREHPFGHARYEYITTLVLSLLILAVGAVLGYTSLMKIITPEPVSASAFTYAVLGVAIAMKGVQAAFYLSVAKKISSDTLKASALDSLTDILATTAALASALVMQFADVNIDGYAGILVAAFIFYTGVKAAKETIDLLLGGSPDKEILKKISEFVKRYPDVIGIHDVMVHDYGPGRQIISFHAEVSAKSDFSYVHDVIDNIERDFQKEYGYLVTIHLDPIVVDDEKVSEMYGFVKATVKEVDENFSIHDFRMTYGGNHINLIFDLLIPVDSKYGDEEAANAVEEKIKSMRPECNCVIKAEHPYV